MPGSEVRVAADPEAGMASAAQALGQPGSASGGSPSGGHCNHTGDGDSRLDLRSQPDTGTLHGALAAGGHSAATGGRPGAEAHLSGCGLDGNTAGDRIGGHLSVSVDSGAVHSTPPETLELRKEAGGASPGREEGQLITGSTPAEDSRATESKSEVPRGPLAKRDGGSAQTEVRMCGVMSRNQKRRHPSIVLDGKLGAVTVPNGVLVDSGAEMCFVAQELVVKEGITMQPSDPVSIRMANGTVYTSNRKVTCMLRLDGWPQAGIELQVVPMGTQNCQVILGMPWLARINPRIDWTAGTVEFATPSGARVVLHSQRFWKHLDTSDYMSGTQLQAAQQADLIDFSWLCLLQHADLEAGWSASELAAEAVERLRRINEEYADVFQEVLPPFKPGQPAHGVKHQIDTVPGSEPPCMRPYRMSEEEYAELKRQLQRALELGTIRPSTSPYGAPVLFVRKKDGTYRMVVDYRALNRITVKNRYPMPTIDELLDRLTGCKVFSGLDLTTGYNQVPMEEESIHKTAFRTRYGHYESVVLPFGLCNAPSTFQRMMNDLLGHLPFVLLYLDDVLIASRNLAEHEEHLRQVLEILRKAKLYAKPSKCHMFQEKVDFLGHMVSSSGIEVDGRKVAAIAAWVAPRNVKELQMFLGAVNFFRRFIRRHAHTALPLTELLKKDRPWIWGDAEQQAFLALQHALVTAPVLHPPDPEKPFILYTDASDIAVGAVVMQDFGSGPQPIAYMSRKHRPAERNYDTREKELLAIVEALKEWRYYFANREVQVFTDHDSLRYLQTQTLPLTGRMARWLECTQEYDLKIGHIPGKQNTMADALSRMFPPEDLESVRQANLTMSLSTDSARMAGATVAAIDSELLDHIRRCYRTDAVARAARQHLAAGEDTSFTEQQGLLYVRKGEGRKLLYIPPGRMLRQLIIAEHHDSGLAGHLGREKTIERLNRLFWWPQLSEHVRDYVETCPSCMMSKPRTGKKPGLLQPMPIPAHAWDHMSMDFVSKLPTAEDGSDGILTCVCMLTKMVRVIETKGEVDAVKTAQLVYKHVWSLFGTPRVIVSDRDPRFTSTFWQTLMRLVKTRLNVSTSFHPETDGQTERMHRLIEEILRHYVNEAQTDWPALLPVVEFAINSSKNRSTGYTPFYLNYGREPATPAAFLNKQETESQGRSTNALAEEIVNKIRSALAHAQENIGMAQEKAREYANRSRKEVTFKRGDKVLLSTRNLARKTSDGSRKLDKLWAGPFTVTEQVGKVSYRLALPPDMRIHDVFHVSLLREFKESSTFKGRPVPRVYTYIPAHAGQGWFIVSKLVGYRKRGRMPQYKVRWENYGQEYDTWEPARHLQQDLGTTVFREFVTEWEATQPKPPKATAPKSPKPAATAQPAAQPTRRSSRLQRR